MKALEEVLHERICAYNKKWQYEKQKDIAACLVDVMAEQLMNQQKKLLEIPKQKQHQLYNYLELTKPQNNQMFMHAQIQKKDPCYLKKGMQILGQDADGCDAIYELCHDLTIQEHQLDSVYSIDAEAKRICICPCKEGKDIRISLETENENIYQLCFYTPHVFDYAKTIAFSLYLDMNNKDLVPFTDETFCQFYIGNDEEKIRIDQVSVQEDHLWLRVQLEQVITITKVWMIIQDRVRYQHRHLQNVSFAWQKQHIHCDHIYGDDCEFCEDEFALFKAPMDLMSSCYFQSNEVLSKRGAQVVLRFDVACRLMEVGMELLQSQPYRGIMRKLPLELPVYDAFAQQIVVEYFNGVAWRMLPGSQTLAKAFQHDEKRVIQFTFENPNDQTPCMIMGEEGYFLRFRLLASDHLFQRPCRIHVPYVSHVRFAYKSKVLQQAKQILRYAHMEVMDIQPFMGNRGCSLIPEFPFRENTCLLAFSTLPTLSTSYFYVTLASSQASGAKMDIMYLGEDQQFHPLYFVDHTNGFTHDGVLEVQFPSICSKQTIFNKKAYWIKITFQNHELKPIHIKQIYANNALLKYKEGTLHHILSLSVIKEPTAQVSVLKGPFGCAQAPQIAQLQSFASHALLTSLHSLSEQDMKQDLLNQFCDLWDVQILCGLDVYGNATPDTYMVLLYRDLNHHHQLYELHKQAIEKFLSRFHALVQGQWILSEPLFIKLAIHAKLSSISASASLWKTEEHVLACLQEYLDPFTSKAYATKDRIHVCLCFNRLEAYIHEKCNVNILEWEIHISYMKQGIIRHCRSHDFMNMPGVVIINGEHEIEIQEVGDTHV